MIAAQQIGMALGDASASEQAESDHQNFLLPLWQRDTVSSLYINKDQDKSRSSISRRSAGAAYPAWIAKNYGARGPS
jgi:hypothetical protein